MQRLNIQETYNMLRDAISSSSNTIAQGAQQAADVAKQTATLNTDIFKQYTDAAMNVLKPLATAGQSSATQLANILGANGPGAQNSAVNQYIKSGSFMTELKAGADLVEQSAAAKGLLNSGRALTELMQYQQQFTGDYMSRIQQGLLGLSQVGGQAAANQAQLQANLGTNIAGQNMYAGDAQANAYMVAANASANADLQRANLASQWIGPMGSVPALMSLLGSQGGGGGYGFGNQGQNYYGAVNAQRQYEAQQTSAAMQNPANWQAGAAGGAGQFVGLF